MEKGRGTEAKGKSGTRRRRGKRRDCRNGREGKRKEGKVLQEGTRTKREGTSLEQNGKDGKRHKVKEMKRRGRELKEGTSLDGEGLQGREEKGKAGITTVNPQRQTGPRSPDAEILHCLRVQGFNSCTITFKTRRRRRRGENHRLKTPCKTL